MNDTFDEIYDKISKKCQERKRCGNCCRLEKEVRKTKSEYSFDEECRKICRSVKKIMKGKQQL